MLLHTLAARTPSLQDADLSCRAPAWLQTNATATVLLYDWGDGNLFWEMELNGVHQPLSLELRVFVDLVNQPLVLALTPSQPFSPYILSYTGSEPRRPHAPPALTATAECNVACLHLERASVSHTT